MHCPVGLRGDFCKHLVATVLTIEDGNALATQPNDPPPTAQVRLADLPLWPARCA